MITAPLLPSGNNAAGSSPDVGAVLDALSSHIAVLDEQGRIVSVNRSWRRFGEENDWSAAESAEGADYLRICDEAHGEGSEQARAVAAAIRAVLSGRVRDEAIEYPCSSPEEERHFVARITGLQHMGARWAVIAHENVTERRRAEEGLRKSEARFRSLIENAPDVITVLDAETTIRYESPSAARVLGYPAEARYGRSFLDFMHAGDLKRLLEIFAAEGDGGRKVTMEFRCQHHDGSWRTFEGTAQNLLADPSASGVVVNYREVTERKRAEEAQARLTAVMDWTPNFIGVADRHGRLSWANRAMRRLIGLSEGAPLTTLNLTDLYPQWAADLLLHKAIPAAIESGVWSGELAHVDATGQEIPVLQVVVAHKSSTGGVEFFSTIAHDITERKRTEATLRESDEVFRQIAENINEMLWIFDLDEGRPVYVSSGYERIWGVPVETSCDEPSSFLTRVTPANRRRVGRIRTGGDSAGREEEFRIVRADGTSRWLRGRSFPIRDAQGSVSRLVGLTEDISERKRMENELRQAQRLEAIGSLAAGIAHEINTPIQYVGDNIRFLQEGFQDLSRLMEETEAIRNVQGEGQPIDGMLERVREVAEEIDLEYVLEEVPRAIAQSLEGVERVAEIVRAMKEFSHPGSSDKTPIDLNRAVKSTLTVARNEWKYVAELELDLDPLLPLVYCFPSELNQALLNIVINAAQSIADRIGSPADALGTIRVRSRENDDWVEIEISDTGTGIPEEIRGRIFDPFFTTKEVGRGTGQGLTLAHSVVVDRHGGSLAFESEVGVGTTFFLRLPVKPFEVDEEEEG